MKSNETDKLEILLHGMIVGLVSNPEEIEVVKVVDQMGTLYTVTVHADDRGKIIGKQGSIADALRVIMRSSGRLIDEKVSLKIEA